MNRTKAELEKKIAELNIWLSDNQTLTYSIEYKQKEHNRNYYVNQLIELEEYGEQTQEHSII